MKRVVGVGALLLTLLAVSCGSSSKGTLTVFAASSMRVVMPQLSKAFAQVHPRTRLRIDYGASGTLVAQIAQGAPADVLVTADEATMDRARADGIVRTAAVTTVATNNLALAVAHGNPKHIRSLAELRNPHLRVAECAPTVPCGALARRVLKAENVAFEPTVLGTNVAETLTQLLTGEVDVALVYVTDARAVASRVDTVSVDARNVTPNRDLAALCTRADDRSLAEQFLEFLASARAQRIFESAGFGPRVAT